jgi:hypothetical protein
MVLSCPRIGSALVMTFRLMTVSCLLSPHRYADGVIGVWGVLEQALLQQVSWLGPLLARS